MVIIVDHPYRPVSAYDDPDDHRPNSAIALALAPATPAGDFVRDVVVLFEDCAPGDHLPLHVHPTTDEVLIIDAGATEVRLGEEVRTVRPGAVVFIPAGTPHATRNVGPGTLQLHAVFPSATISMQYLERIPAPGTDGDPPQPAATLDLRAWAGG